MWIIALMGITFIPHPPSLHVDKKTYKYPAGATTLSQ